MRKLVHQFMAGLMVLAATQVQGDYNEPYSTMDASALEKADDFIPAGWEAIALVQGDLNQDQRTDYALVIQSRDPQRVHSQGGLVPAEINANPRHLLLLFAAEDDASAEPLSRKRIYRRFIPAPDPEFPHRVEPLSYIGINDGVLELKFEVWASEGSWERDDLTYKFRYQKKKDKFVLIGYDHRNVHRNSGMFQATSIDLLTGQQIKTAGSMSSPRHRKESGTFKAKRSWTLCDIKDALHFAF